MIERETAIRLRDNMYEIRMRILDCIRGAGGGHIGGSMSVAECIAALYLGAAHISPDTLQSPDRDKILLSKGHSGAALYATLAYLGYFDSELLSTMNANGTRLPGHPDRTKLPGVEISTGSLGQGGSMAAGFAYADMLDGRDCKTFLILGDGELNEGQTWEAMMLIAHHNLRNLITIVDNNGLQCDGTLDEICKPFDIGAKFRAFGFETIDVPNGNEIIDVYETLRFVRAKQSDRPICVLLHTKKGAKMSLFENVVAGHHCKMTDEQYRVCKRDLAIAFGREEGTEDA